MATIEFGDIEIADAWDETKVIATEQVAYRLHELRQAFEDLAGRNVGAFNTLDYGSRQVAFAIAVLLIRYIQTHEPDNPAQLAEAVHNARRFLSGGKLPVWDDLTSEQRQIGIDLMQLIINWLDRQGAR